MSRRFLFGLVLFFLSLTTSAATRLKIITHGGVVEFVAGDDWPVLSMQGKLPIATVAFQIPNAADRETPHSSNLALSLYDMHAEAASTSFAAQPVQYGAIPVQSTLWEGWTIFRQEAPQGDIRYTILDAKRPELGDVAASVRLAWPHLSGNSATFDTDMEARFHEFLRSVQARVGPYAPEANEVVRRSSP